MKIICVGTLDKFSRFYLKIKKELDSKDTFRIYSLYISGFLYTLFRFQFSCLLPLKTWSYTLWNKNRYERIIRSQTKYKGIDYKALIQYHLKVYPSNSIKNLSMQALAYIDIIDRILNRVKPDCIILIGDSKLSIETFVVLAKKKGVKVFYIEQGPFNSTFFNDTGVNANAEINFAENDIEAEAIDIIHNFINAPKDRKYFRSSIYRAIDYFIALLFEKTIVYPPDRKYTDTSFPAFFKRKNNTERNDTSNTKKHSFLLVLQVPIDVNMIYHSPNFNNHYDIVKTVHKNLPKDAVLTLREHPVYVGNYEEKLYDYVETNNLKIDSSTPLTEALKRNDVIVVNNSTVGIEAILQKKAVVVLGNAYYDKDGICLKYNDDADMKALLIKSLSFSPNEKKINNFMYQLIGKNLVKGYITDQKSVAAKHIAHKLLQQFHP